MRLVVGAAVILAVATAGLDARPAAAGGETARQSYDFSSQSRPRPRIRVTPRQPDYWLYPRPGDYSWPGPNAYRDCVAWLEPEWRPSGTVIIPRTRCRWVRG